MTSSARDLRYGRRGGRWAEPWTDADEARYRAAKTRLEQQSHDDPDQPALFTDDDTDPEDR